ncbi:LysR substrate-binding domain-containing protein [Vibrio sp. SCSIO 43136]|uniref:LysR substrate-binding domain-containing protein n=1 Tax=Vibrio sp. SCSIO 43136 TaxID=2819101 RepID=UPI002076280F|nr:LysR substrate-binding domain-containing protein [Vibrio sp. SCSIO 43136]USD68086.1 LysR family transcriptional regulator [Vibrio sp. SCSIO 43136]
MNIPLKSLYAFVAVAETGSMTEAAKWLNVSHSAVSQSIKTLEQYLAQPLFVRSGRNVTLSAKGQAYYKKVAPALEQISDATSLMRQQHTSNRLTLNMITSLAMHWWIPRMSDFQAFAPEIDIRVSNLVGSFDMEQQGIDAAIIHGHPNDWQDYYCEKLSDDELILVASPDIADARMRLEDVLRRLPAIFINNPRRKADWDIWCSNKSLTVPKVQKSLNFSTSVQGVHAAIRKLGILVTHRQFVRDDIASGLLVELGSPVTNPEHDFYFACAPRLLKSESVLKLRNWLRTEFSANAAPID